MGLPKCHDCHSPLSNLFIRTEKGDDILNEYGFCFSCKQPKPISDFFRKFGFEPFEKQNDLERLELQGHTLIWKDVLGKEQYYCTTCDQEILHSHHHHSTFQK